MRTTKSVYLFVIAFILSLVPFAEIHSAEPETVETHENESVEVQAPASPVVIRSFRSSVPSNIIKLNFGPTWMMSRVETSQGEYTGTLAVVLTAEYTHYWQGGIGLGVTMDYSYFYFDYDNELSMLYAAPTFSYSWRPARKLLMELGAGLGGVYYTANSYSHDRHRTENDFGLGLHTRFGVEYMLNNHFGLGGEVNTLMSLYPDNTHWLKNRASGFFRMNIVTGVRFYF